MHCPRGPSRVVSSVASTANGNAKPSTTGAATRLTTTLHRQTYRSVNTFRQTRARGKRDEADVEVVFDGIEDPLSPTEPSSSFLMDQAIRSVGIVVDQLADVAMQFVPEGTPYDVVKVAVVGGVALVVLSFVKGILSFAITLGSIGFGAYVWVNVYGGGVSSPGGRKSGSKKRSKKTGRPIKSPRSSTANSRRVSPDGLLGSLGGLIDARFSSSKEDDGILDVTFRRNGDSGRKRR
jgi:hypothetical protein